jgi:type II secretory pathway pseudopilin PulG
MIMKIFNLKHRQKGFTLVELLTSTIVLVVIGSVITGVIVSSLRGSNKANNIENIRQVGNYALNQMAKNIQYAQIFNGLKTDQPGAEYTTTCPFATPTPPAQPQAVKTSYNYIKITPLNGNPIEYKCIPPVPPSIVPTFTVNDMVSEKEIVDIDYIDLRDCSITCTQTNATDVPIIGISFSLAPKGSNGLVESSNPPIAFETSVTVRNYSR